MRPLTLILTFVTFFSAIRTTEGHSGETSIFSINLQSKGSMLGKKAARECRKEEEADGGNFKATAGHLC